MEGEELMVSREALLAASVISSVLEKQIPRQLPSS